MGRGWGRERVEAQAPRCSRDRRAGAMRASLPARVALIGALLDLNGHRVEVDVAVAQREHLSLPQQKCERTYARDRGG
jgi:hypothetical protein